MYWLIYKVVSLESPFPSQQMCLASTFMWSMNLEYKGENRETIELPYNETLTTGVKHLTGERRSRSFKLCQLSESMGLNKTNNVYREFKAHLIVWNNYDKQAVDNITRYFVAFICSILNIIHNRVARTSNLAYTCNRPCNKRQQKLRQNIKYE
jgi:hypothetical protein